MMGRRSRIGGCVAPNERMCVCVGCHVKACGINRFRSRQQGHTRALPPHGIAVIDDTMGIKITREGEKKRQAKVDVCLEGKAPTTGPGPQRLYLWLRPHVSISTQPGGEKTQQCTGWAKHTAAGEGASPVPPARPSRLPLLPRHRKPPPWPDPPRARQRAPRLP